MSSKQKIIQDGVAAPKVAEGIHGLPHDAGFVGDSTAMQAVYRTISQVAHSDVTVFVTGESGTGKELCAQAIHKQSARRNKPFLIVHCGSVPQEKLKSEIFGWVDGGNSLPGAAELAEGGTLCLDEIIEMDLLMQAKLLRFVQSHSYTPAGSDETRHADIRIICTTSRDPVEEMRAGRLREDLFYRLYVVPLHLPPLYARDADIGQIADSILQSAARDEGKEFIGFAPDVIDLFERCRWPGNVRQLKNLVRNVVVLHDGGVVTGDMLPGDLLGQCGIDQKGAYESKSIDAGAASAGTIKPLWLSEKEAIENAIRQCGGNIPKAAKKLQVSASTLYRKRQGWADMERKGRA